MVTLFYCCFAFVRKFVLSFVSSTDFRMDKESGFGVDSLPPVTAVVTTSLASGFGAAGGGEVRASRVQARDRLLPAPGIFMPGVSGDLPCSKLPTDTASGPASGLYSGASMSRSRDSLTLNKETPTSGSPPRGLARLVEAPGFTAPVLCCETTAVRSTSHAFKHEVDPDCVHI